MTVASSSRPPRGWAGCARLTRDAFRDLVDRWPQLIGAEPRVVAADAHPDLFSARLAHERAVANVSGHDELWYPSAEAILQDEGAVFTSIGDAAPPRAALQSYGILACNALELHVGVQFLRDGTESTSLLARAVNRLGQDVRDEGSIVLVRPTGAS